MKQRFTGKVDGDCYEISDPSGVSVKRVPLAEAREDRKLKAAIERNGWEAI